jgi:predicted RNA binding protein YcfA (HicA-like mRNA interferase family)
MPMTGKEMLKLLKKHGWQVIRINGSHHIVAKEGVPYTSLFPSTPKKPSQRGPSTRF